MQRWGLLLSVYSYDICYRPTTAHSNADGLSCLPLPSLSSSDELTIFNMAQLDVLPVHNSAVKTSTITDSTLSRVLNYTRARWPAKVPEALAPYRNRRAELSVEEGCLLWGTRVLILTDLQPKVLEELHKGHPGIVRMKALARSHVWWPSIDRHLEEKVKACTPCQQQRHAPPKAPLHPWAWPSFPWQRIHVDFAGPVARGRCW